MLELAEHALACLVEAVVERLFFLFGEELVEKTEFCFSCDYGLYETLKRQIKDFKLYDVQESYSDTVTLKGKILSEQFKTFSDKIKNISSGKIIL